MKHLEEPKFWRPIAAPKVQLCGLAEGRHKALAGWDREVRVRYDFPAGTPSLFGLSLAPVLGGSGALRAR